MIISDLNYLEITSEEIFGGRGIKIAGTYSGSSNFTGKSSLVDTTVINATANVRENIATAYGAADARETENTYTNVYVAVETGDDHSESVAGAIAVSDDARRRR